jgi:cystathionine gamma-synthase
VNSKSDRNSKSDGNSKLDDRHQPATRAVRAALESDTQFGAVVPPLHLSSNYSFAGFGQRRQYDYGRSGNPTRDALAEALADLEGGAGAVVTASGMAAVTLVCQLLQPGDRLLAPHDCYGGTYRLFEANACRGLFEVDFVDQTNSVELQQAMTRRPKMVWIETPSNPLLRVVDIQAIVTQAHAQRAIVIVDNTFLSPVWQRPFELGADAVVHSTTKYLNGHSDVVGGAVVARNGDLLEQLQWWANCLGLIGAPFDSYLTLRGLRTLHARMRVHGENAEQVAGLLASHEAVKQVFYPGLTSHPQHELAARQQSGFGAMVSFALNGNVESVRRFVNALSVFSLAESLGGVESLVAHPATMTHADRAGIVDTLLRLSIGIEDSRDLINDLQVALNASKS